MASAAGSYYDQLVAKTQGPGMDLAYNSAAPSNTVDASWYDSVNPTAPAYTWTGSAPAPGSSGTVRAPAAGLGGYGGLGSGTMSGSYTGGTSSGVGGYSLPDSAGASAAMRALQMQSMSGLQGLMNTDTSAQRKKIEDALYATSSRGINTAADRARQQMLEGTFGRGVGSSSIGIELAGRQQQEQSDALAQAAREAFTQAGSEQRADLASALGLNTAGFNAGTSGLQGEANVALANLAREQQASQFAQNLQFQGGENAANRAQAASQFGQNLGLNYAQLGQQANQFGQNLGFQGTQNQLNREQSTSEAALNRQLQQMLLESQQGFSGGQNDATRQLQKYLADTQQSWAGGQNQLNRDADMQKLLLSLANTQDIAAGNQAGRLGQTAAGGVGALLGPFLAQYLKSLGE